jgi:hypothetical protein
MEGRPDANEKSIKISTSLALVGLNEEFDIGSLLEVGEFMDHTFKRIDEHFPHQIDSGIEAEGFDYNSDLLVPGQNSVAFRASEKSETVVHIVVVDCRVGRTTELTGREESPAIMVKKGKESIVDAYAIR